MFVCSRPSVPDRASSVSIMWFPGRETQAASDFYPLSNLKSCISKCFLEYDGQIRKLSVIKYEKIHEF